MSYFGEHVTKFGFSKTREDMEADFKTACAEVDRLRAENAGLVGTLERAYRYIKSDKCACEFEADGDEYTCARCKVVDAIIAVLPAACASRTTERP